MANNTPTSSKEAAETIPKNLDEPRSFRLGFGRLLTRMSKLYQYAEDQVTEFYWATYGVALTRIVLGITGVGLLVTNFASRHYTFGVGSAWTGELSEPKSAFPDIWLFSAFHHAATLPWFYTTLYLLLGVLAILVTLGWRTRLILPVYLVLWVSFIETNHAVSDQGDNAYRMFLLAMIFTNSTIHWSLDAHRRKKTGKPATNEAHKYSWITVTAHNLALVVLAFQVCAIYFAGGLYKAGGDPWKEGYAVYEPLQTAQFGTWPILSELLTAWGPGVVILTWGSMIFQIAFPFLLLNRYTRIIALIGILSFHAGIGLLMGLPWFSLTMIAVDAIFIRNRTYRRIAHLASLTTRRLGNRISVSKSAA